jgi:hypothetical protein
MYADSGIEVIVVVNDRSGIYGSAEELVVV